MNDIITLSGFVATTPKGVNTSASLPMATFRLASSQRRLDKSTQRWTETDTNWYTITAFRQLAENVLSSVKKGEPVIVTGRLRIRDWTSGERSGTTIDISADSVGHDLGWGTAVFARTVTAAQAPVADAGERSGADVGDDAATDVSAATGPDTVVPVVDEVEVPF